MTDTQLTTLIAAYWLSMLLAGGFLAWLAFVAVRGCARYYRQHRPMATRVAPADDDRSSVRNFKRMMQP